MYTLHYHERKVRVPFKASPKMYKALIKDESGKIVEGFCNKDKRALRHLLRNFGYIK